MTSLPVLHLKATSRQNMTIARDPYETTVTLYTFLRSLPSLAEREIAFQPFLDALHVAPSSGRAALLRKPNHRLVQLLEAVAVDGVFRNTPHTIPALARHSERWVNRLGYDEGCGEPTSASEAQQRRAEESLDESSGRLPTSSSASAAPSTQQVIRASDMHQYHDPYAAYEATYTQRSRATADSALGEEDEEPQHSADIDGRQLHPAYGRPQRGEEEVEEQLQYSGSTQAPEEPREHTIQQRQQQQHRSYLSAEVSALTAAESDMHNGNDSNGSTKFLETSNERALREDASPGGLHPVLELISRQVEQAAAEPASISDAACLSSGPSSASMDAAIKSRILAITSRLDDVAEEVGADMHAQEAEGQAWSPYYSRLRSSLSVVESLQERLGSAISLYQLQRYERETLQQTRVAVQMEALSLRLVLRDVQARLDDAEADEAGQSSQRAGGHGNNEKELIDRLRAVLRPTVEADADTA